METPIIDWDYDELRLFISAMLFTESPEQSKEFAKKANDKYIQFKRLGPTDHLEGALVCHVATRILDAKVFNEDVTIDLADAFESRYIWLESLVEKNKNSKHLRYLTMLLHVMKIRRNIFNNDRSEIFALCDALTQYSEELSEMIQREVDFYLIEDVFK